MEKKEYDAFTTINGKQTDKDMHDLNDDKDLIKRINEHYRTTKDPNRKG